MAERWAVANGNWSATGTWNGGTLPDAGDDVHANGYTVTINQDITVASLRTTAGSTPAAGGGFPMSTAYTINGNLIGGTTTVLVVSATTGTATINGSVTAGSGASAHGINRNGACTLVVNGDVTGGTNAGVGIYTSVGGVVTVTGNVTGGSTGANGYGIGGVSGTLTVVGNVTGGSAANCHGINAGTGSTNNITGTVTGGSGTSAIGITSANASTVNVTGNVIGGAGGIGYTSAAAGATINVYGEARGTTSNGGNAGVSTHANSSSYVQISVANNYPNDGITAPALGTIQASGTGAITIDAMVFGSGGVAPCAGRHFIRNAGTNYVTMRESNAGATLNMGELSADYPTQANVRSGVSYDFGNKTGTCAVPAAGSVAFGVAVDNTTGTAALSPTALLGADLKTRLENCATVQTVGDQLAALGV